MKRNFTKTDILLWAASVALVLLTFVIFDRENYLVLAASLIGVTSLIFNAKGNPLGQVLMIVFSILYGIISYSFAYYGEMITYLGMTAPMALFSLISWLTHPYEEDRSEVAVNHLTRHDGVVLTILTGGVTVVFYFVLAYFHTVNLIPSTISVTTSFVAAYLTYQRSPWFALAYAANDVILVILWVLAALTDSSYILVTVCFAVFFFNDVYGFISWRKMEKKQAQNLHGKG